MSLNEKIRSVIQSSRDSFPPELTALIEQGAGEISALEIVEKSLGLGDQAPSFTVNNYQGKTCSLEDYLENGPVVLTFYRGVWCPYCNLQLAEYNARLQDIRNAGGTLVAISPEKPEAIDLILASDVPPEAKEMIVNNLDFDVLHDVENKVARKFGLVFELPDSHKKLFDLMGLDVEKLNGDGSYTFPDPATYVICQDRQIAWAFVPNNYRKRAEADDIIRILKNISKSSV